MARRASMRQLWSSVWGIASSWLDISHLGMTLCCIFATDESPLNLSSQATQVNCRSSHQLKLANIHRFNMLALLRRDRRTPHIPWSTRRIRRHKLYPLSLLRTQTSHHRPCLQRRQSPCLLYGPSAAPQSPLLLIPSSIGPDRFGP